jgi:ABC-type bacteriocin/lantibiotic exporter with double-glycine peptidase domain
LADFYGTPVTINELRTRLHTDPLAGTTLKAFTEGLTDLFDVEVGRATSGVVPRDLLPFIAYLPRLRHYVTVWTLDERRGRVLLGDPAAGLTSVSIEDFLSDWNGIAVVLRPRDGGTTGVADGTVFIPTRPVDSLFAAFVLVFSSGSALFYGVLALGVLAGAASTCFSAAVPYLLTRPSTLIVVAAAFVFVSSALAVATTWVTALAQRRQSLRLGGQLSDAFDRLDHSFYTVGDYYSRFGDTQGLVSSLITLARDAVYAGVLVVGVVIYLAIRDWQLAVFLVGLVAVIGAAITPFVSRMRGLTYRLRLRASSLNNEVSKAWATHDGRFDSWPELVQTSYNQALWSLPVRATVSQMSTLGLIAVIAFSASQHPGLAGLPELLGLLTFMGYLTTASVALYQHYTMWQTTRPAVQRILDVLQGGS